MGGAGPGPLPLPETLPGGGAEHRLLSAASAPQPSVPTPAAAPGPARLRPGPQDEAGTETGWSPAAQTRPTSKCLFRLRAATQADVGLEGFEVVHCEPDPLVLPQTRNERLDSAQLRGSDHFGFHLHFLCHRN